ncbi:MAG: gliding motility-associated C-terminal domain-containing protein [Cytophagaceae bacterium]|nr:gliding motility-associated C-terminal domain-containing protein [Cytophagaceae bacterium]
MQRILLSLALFLTLSSSGAVFTVTNTNTTGAGSLQQAILDANALAGADTIVFNITGTAPFIINLGGSTLASINQATFVNGASQTGFTGVPLIEIRGAGGPGLDLIPSASGSEILGLAITGGAAMGINLQASNTRIHGCYIGLRTDGTTAGGNAAMGINISNVTNVRIGGTYKNVIANSGSHGVSLLNVTASYLFNNIIGLSANGLTPAPNQNGINADNAPLLKIGGTSSDSMNIISGNRANGIEVGNNLFGPVIQGNYIGCASNGTADVGNTLHGIYLNNISSALIGGTGASTRNVISGNNGQGIELVNSPKTKVQSNYIGVSSNGLLALGNSGNAVQLTNSRECVIGGDRATQGNVLSNCGAGFNDEGNSKYLIFQGNIVGADKDGFQDFGNTVIGVIIKSDSALIGGETPAFGNIIVHTKILCGILLGNSSYNKVKYNLIGLNPDSADAGNEGDGINVGVELAGQSARNNLIEYNAIAFNKRNGIAIGDALNATNSTNEFNNTVQYNHIFCNTLKGINLNRANSNDWGNNGRPAPVINSALSNDTMLVGFPSGLTANDRIDVYRMSDCISCDNNPQGRYYVGTTQVNADGSWSYRPGISLEGSLVAVATDVNGNSSEFSLCYTPCKATVSLEKEEAFFYLKDHSEQTLALQVQPQFSNLSPLPGQIYWMLNTNDTSMFASKTNSKTWSVGVSAPAEITAGVNQIVVVVRQGACMDTAQMNVRVLYIPNLITPNGDGKNDQWVLSNAPGLYEVHIYNRWGDKVYDHSDYTNGFNAGSLSDGNYFYEIIEKKEGERYKGWLQILR